MPLGTYTNPRRCGAVDAVAAESAGSMASRNGSEIAAPTPRMNVRRFSDTFVMIIGQILNSCAACVVPRASLTRDGRLQRRRAVDPSELEGIALHNTQNDRLDPVATRGCVFQDLPHGRHVVVFQASTERVGQQLLGHGVHEAVGMA